MGQVWEGTSPRWAGAPPSQGPKAPKGRRGANPKGRWALGPMPGAPPSPLHLAATQMGSGGCRHP